MTDASRTERVLNCIPSKDIEKDWLFENAVEAGILEGQQRIPPRKDLRDDSWWKIGDQRDTGSCVGWAAADSVLRWHFVQAGLAPKDGALSVRFIWMAAKETDEYTSYPSTFIESSGTSLKSALDVARKYGMVYEDALPLFSGELYSGQSKTFYALASKLKIAAYFSLGNDAMQWKTWIAEHGPILTRLDVDATWDSIGADGRLDTYKPSSTRGGHAVAIVGYTEDRFIVRNSWGVAWGDAGYAHASVEYAKAAFSEAYGVSL